MASSLKEVSCKAIQKAADDLYALSRDIWEHPELGYEEIYAHQRISEFLEKQGFQVERHFVLETGFRTTIGSNTDGPHIAVLCEYDALPDIGHACGHNLICEVGLAAGIGIKAAFEANGNPLGKVTILGTPAEEGAGGKLDMINAHVFDDVDAAMMAHPGHYNSTKTVALAIEQINVLFHGKASHASAKHWKGVNALDAAVLCYQNLSCMRQQLDPGWQLHGIIKNGGSKPNIIPELTELEFYIRAPRLKELDQLREKFVACAEAAATATGCRSEIIREDRPFYDMVNNDTMAGLYLENAKTVGVDFESHPEDNDDLGSTDMGNVSNLVPSIHPMFFISQAIYHTRDFAAVTGEPEAQAYTLTVAKALAMTAIDMYTDTSMMTTIKEEFQQTKS